MARRTIVKAPRFVALVILETGGALALFGVAIASPWILRGLVFGWFS
jgi:hypothetical protein